ncbi:MAG: alpha/beta hydrolase [Nitrospinaceae bacterium]|jgi:pimeloyl-ACP methyl ester carboxylesterase|nr:alpha/beta hydrolase [Nitrospinaceae bacterium]MBT3434628.1 alpha/beta hydrolase [Nitrospinaceae bacterium]MBT3821745.1 alpha/beta hydrolase [Nitrospinaceae bacterium]MBT4093763.1 alpha/beta hydrolase [Nitrospinaceae bacterium]MBT4428946.1 alpha/beta hydrolase [Nitrospinaceae bacterium]
MEFIELAGRASGGGRIAYEKFSGNGPGVVFLGGFHSDMSGTKASALAAYCFAAGRRFIRFDYTGHGISSGAFEEGTIGEWAEDAVAVLDEVAEGPQVLVGSSMGGWIMCLAALARPERVCGLVGVAAAPDFTEDLIWEALPEGARREIAEKGSLTRPSEYDEAGYPITMKLIEEGRRHLLLRAPIDIKCPVRLIHGVEDESVPWEVSRKLMGMLESEDVSLNLIKGGDHRLSEPADIERLIGTVEMLCVELKEG